MSDDEVCGAVKKAGDGTCPIDFGLCAECGLCFTHCEHREEERKAATHRGGRTTALKRGNGDRSVPLDQAPDPPETLGDAVRWASWASLQVATGGIDTSRANAVARLLKEFRQALEKSESRQALEKIDELRERIEGGDADLEVVE